MSKKIAVLSVVMLVLGGVAIPGGFIVNNVIDSMVTDRVDDGLLGIEEQFIPMAEQMILEIGPAIALQMIKELAIPASYELLYASFLTQLLYNAYDIGEERSISIGFPLYITVSGGDCLLNMFFDKVQVNLGALGGGTTSFSAELKNAGIPNAGGQYILGISEWNQEDLNIGQYDTADIIGYGIYPKPNPNDRLAWGQSIPIWPNSDYKDVNNPPGFMQHTEKGFGILQFLENFTRAQEIGTQAAYDAFCNPYEEGGRDIPFSKMEVVHDYFYEYWIPVAMPLLLADLQDEESEFAQHAQEYIGMELDDIAYYEFLKQWTSFSTYANGVDFHNFGEDFPPGMHGLEVNSPTIPVDSLYALWDELNEWSLLNMTGIEKWLSANSNSEDKSELELHFGLNSEEAQDILDWLWNGPDSFSQGVLPVLLESEMGYGMSLTEFAKQVMLEQWANGTVMGMTMFEGGIDFSDFINSLPPGSTGFEVGVPVPTGMSMDSALLLWDTSNPYSLVKDISLWWNIGPIGSESYTTIRDANLLDDATMEMILKWLPRFKNDLMPALAQYEMGLPMDTTTLGNTIQIGGMIIGAIAIGLASTGLVSNRVVSRKKKYTSRKFKKYDKNYDKLFREND